MTREELQSAIQDFWDEAFHHSKHPEISDTSKAIALECMMDAAEHKRTCSFTNADRIRAMSDEDLAAWLTYSICKYVQCRDSCPVVSGEGPGGEMCKVNILHWLQQPAEEER